MRVLVWLLRAFIFFSLFAFALNNQQAVTVRWFFGAEWTAPMVLVVLASFAVGCLTGVLAMLPGWWRERRAVQRLQPASAASAGGASSSAAVAPEHPPRDGI
jgi:putative membrane protein